MEWVESHEWTGAEWARVREALGGLPRAQRGVTHWGSTAGDPLPEVAVTYAIDVGWTSSRPVIPDEHVRRVVVSSTDGTGREATLVAAQMVACDPRCEMPTSTTIVGVEA